MNVGGHITQLKAQTCLISTTGNGLEFGNGLFGKEKSQEKACLVWTEKNGGELDAWDDLALGQFDPVSFDDLLDLNEVELSLNNNELLNEMGIKINGIETADSVNSGGGLIEQATAVAFSCGEPELTYIMDLIEQAEPVSSPGSGQVSSPSAEVTYADMNSLLGGDDSTRMGGEEEDEEAESDEEEATESSSSSPTAAVRHKKSAAAARRGSNASLRGVSGGGKVDKRESNKAASNRYRSRKLKERDQLFADCEFYAAKNNELKKKVADLQVEISFIKDLLVQALLKKNAL